MKRLVIYLPWLGLAIVGSALYFFTYRPLSHAHTQLKLEHIRLQKDHESLHRDNETLHKDNEVLAAERDQALRSKHNIDKMALEAGDALESCRAQLSLAPWAQAAVQFGEAFAPDKIDINGVNVGLPKNPRSRR